MKQCQIYLKVENNGGKDAEISDDRKHNEETSIIVGRYIKKKLMKKKKQLAQSRTLTFQKNMFYVPKREPFKNDEKCFFFILKAFSGIEKEPLGHEKKRKMRKM